MDFETYQKEVKKYDFTADTGLLIPLMGLCGEIGEINSVLKKRYRDRAEYQNFSNRLREELGDALWYLTSVCTHLDFKLADIANENLRSKKYVSKTHVCKDFPEYQKKVTKDTPKTKKLSLISCLSKNAANLFKIYTETLKSQRNSKKFKNEMAKEIGDVFWDLANVASAYELQLEYIAYSNLAKVSDIHAKGGVSHFDKAFPKKERFPRKFQIKFEEKKTKGKLVVEISQDGKKVGNELDDNSSEEDNYRFHDVLHLAYVAILGWSPTMRGLLKHKRKSDPDTDRIQDGARAIFLEEALSLYIFNEASKNNLFKDAKSVDLAILKMVKELTKNLEVKSASHKQWENAILEGYKMFRLLVEHKGGVIALDLEKRKITFKKIGGKRASNKRK